MKCGQKMNHPFVFMCFGIFLWCINVSSPRTYSYSSAHEYNALRAGSNDFEVSSWAQRPVMYTFYEKIDERTRGTGMDEDSDTQLLNEWRKMWSNAGWDAIVLNLGHAKRHPRYEEFRDKLEGIPMKGTGGAGLNRFYNELCFYRWLAMSAVGGGWMSDYDTMPIGFGSGANLPQSADLPNDGSFSIFSISPGSKGAGIPCLMSGTDREWERMAFAVVENGLSHQDESHWTDMFSLMDLRHSSKYLYHYSDEVVRGEDAFQAHEFTKDDCETLLKGMRAVHFSHSAMSTGHWRRHVNNGDVDENVNEASYRPNAIKNVYIMWRDICGNDDIVILPNLKPPE